jgi:type I restriction enzyme S subunit
MSETALSAIAEINPGARIPKEITGSDEVSFIPMSDVSESGDWITRQTRPLRSVTAGFTAFEEGDVLVAKITPCLENGKGAHARGLRNGIGFGSTEFHVLRAKQGVEPRFVFHITQSRSFRQAAERQMVGSAGQQRVQRQFFDEFLVKDFSQGEQRAIAQILDTLDTAIRETEALIDKLKAVKQGLLHDLLTRGIDANGELRPPQSEAPQLYKESPLGWGPREWTQGKLSEVLEIGLGFAFRSEDYTENGILSFRVTNIGRPLEDFGGSIFLPDSFWDKYKSQQLTGGEIVIVMVGATTGKLGLVPVDVCPALQNQNMWNLIPAPGVEREFLWMLLPSAVQRHLSLAQGSARDFLTQKDFLETEIAFPNANEQRRIISAGEALEQRIVSEQQYLKKLSAQKVGLMDDLLTGRVRVTPLLEASS